MLIKLALFQMPKTKSFRNMGRPEVEQSPVKMSQKQSPVKMSQKQSPVKMSQKQSPVKKSKKQISFKSQNKESDRPTWSQLDGKTIPLFAKKIFMKNLLNSMQKRRKLSVVFSDDVRISDTCA